MNKTMIMVIGGNEAMLQSIVKLINANDAFNAIYVTGTENAVEKFHQIDFDIIILSYDLPAEEERKLRKIFLHQHPELVIMQYNDTEADALDKIKGALNKYRKQNKPSVAFIDDALKNAMLRINVQ